MVAPQVKSCLELLQHHLSYQFVIQCTNLFVLSSHTQATYPMNINVYTREGSHYYAYDDESQWDMIASYTNYTYDYDNDEDPLRISFPPQLVGAGQVRAFYIAIVETYGESRPLAQGLIAGTDYLSGVWATDDRLSLLEGIKFYGISDEYPFGQGTDESGVYNHQGPGGISYNMKDAIIRYRPIDTASPSVSPSITQVPTVSQMPSIAPSISEQPSFSPSLSISPTPAPTGSPSSSQQPSSQPSMNPSSRPSLSAQPSDQPSVSAQPSEPPSAEVS